MFNVEAFASLFAEFCIIVIIIGAVEHWLLHEENLPRWAAEFGKICARKLWSLTKLHAAKKQGTKVKDN